MKTNYAYKIFMAMNTAALIAGPVIICLFIGVWLDGLLATSPALSITGGLMGFGASMVSLIRLMKSMK